MNYSASPFSRELLRASAQRSQKLAAKRLTLVVIAALSVGAEPRDAVTKFIDADMARMLALYKHIHAHPELSYQEVETAARLAKELRDAGFDVTEKVGGTGVVGVLKNGAGPTVLVRADMDALPVVEQTGLLYASKVRTLDKNKNDVGVMHACGHDVNVTCLTGTVRVLAAMKDKWSGTLVFIGQPAEEVGGGARAMLADGLFKPLSEARLRPGPALRRPLSAWTR